MNLKNRISKNRKVCVTEEWCPNCSREITMHYLRKKCKCGYILIACSQCAVPSMDFNKNNCGSCFDGNKFIQIEK